MESSGAQVCHRAFKGNFYKLFYAFSYMFLQLLFPLRELLPTGGITDIFSITQSPTSSGRTPMSTCWTCLYSETLNQWRQEKSIDPFECSWSLTANFSSCLLQYGVKKIKRMPYNHQHQYFFLCKLKSCKRKKEQ